MSSSRLLLLNAVGLTQSLIQRHRPDWLKTYQRVFLRPTLPAVTCSVQTSMLTGVTPSEHGIVGNGWYDRDLCEVHFWKQSAKLIQKERVWSELRRRNPDFKVAKFFWWYNMYDDVDYSITPRPCYPSDGRKVPEIYSYPSDFKNSITEKIGPFPFFKFWGPATDFSSTRWIGEATKLTMQNEKPHLLLSYLPHLDYILQREGPLGENVGSHVNELLSYIDTLLATAKKEDYTCMILSEYGIERCEKDFALNRLFRKKGWLRVREELGLEILDAGACQVFAVADHQVAHIVLNDKSLRDEVIDLLKNQEEVGEVLSGDARTKSGLDHPRAGDLIAISKPGYWFSYYYWLDEEKRPDFAPTVDIHRKPGYDPAELFIDPKLSFPKFKIATHILKKNLGFRSLLEVIPTNGDQVKGSHGRTDMKADEGALLLAPEGQDLPDTLDCTEIHHLIRKFFS